MKYLVFPNFPVLEAPIFFFFFLHSDRLRNESNGWELKTNVNKVAKTS